MIVYIMAVGAAGGESRLYGVRRRWRLKHAHIFLRQPRPRDADGGFGFSLLRLDVLYLQT